MLRKTRALAGLLALLLGAAAQAATFNVTTTLDRADANPGDGICATDTGVCTLRAAIQEANALPGPDVINLQVQSTYRIRLRGNGEDDAATGDLDIRDDLSIIGSNPASPGSTVIDGSRGLYLALKERVFHIVGSYTRPINVVFENFTIARGEHRDATAGGGNICIACEELTSPTTQPLVAHNVTLRNMIIRDGYAYTMGGGIASLGANLVIEDSVITGNITGYQVVQSSITFISGGDGGGIANLGGTVTLRRTQVNSNRGQLGGGVFNAEYAGNAGQLIVENSEINNNTAFQGGAIYNLNGKWDISTRTLIDYGVRLDQSTLSGNWADVAGGGIYNLGLGSVLIANSTISNNRAETVLSGPHIFDGLSQVGGGLYHAGTIMDVIGGTVAGNIVGDGFRMMMNGDVILGGRELFVNTINVPRSGFPFWVSFQNTILGDTTSAGDVCNGSTGFTAYVTDSGGNTVADNTCGVVTSAKALGKAVLRAGADSEADWLKLGPLANNGGLPGQALPDGTYPATRALLPGSPALNAGTNCPRFDQRGFARSINRCDSGAFQVGANTKGYASEPANLPPVVKDDAFITPAGKKLVIKLLSLLANDVDPDGDVLYIDKQSLVGKTSKGGRVTLAGTSLHFLHYQPPAGFEGVDSFSYQVSDGNFVITGTVNVQVTADNLAPGAGDILGLQVRPGDVLLVDPVENRAVYDPEEQPLSYVLVSEPAQGRVEVVENGFIYTANSDATGIDSFTYRVSDGERQSEAARVIITINGSRELQLSDYPFMAEAGKLVYGDLSSLLDADPFYSYFLDTQNARYGELMWLDPISGEFVYRLHQDALGQEELNYIVSNSIMVNGELQDVFSTARVTIAITPPRPGNSAPTADNVDLGVLLAGEAYEIQLPAQDADGDVLLFELLEQPNYGQVEVVNPATGVFKLIPGRQASVSRDWFTYSVTDGVSESAPIQVAFSVDHTNNQLPEGVPDQVSTPADLPLIIDVVANDIDADGDRLEPVLQAAASAQGGTLEVVDGRVSYVPPVDFAGSDSFYYSPSDGYGSGEPVLVTIEVIPASAAPLEAAKEIESIWTDDSTVVLSSLSSAATVTDGRGGLAPWWLAAIAGWMTLVRVRRRAREKKCH